MKKLIAFVLLASVAWAAMAQTNRLVEKKSPDGKYTYLTDPNDPLGVRIYTLANGLTVMLSVNRAEPRIQTFIGVKAGSKTDPADNTGLAHYLEHLMFKGTTHFGTLDYAKEKPYLDQIDALYETYNKATDPGQRKMIYHQIDSVSQLASKWSIANEYDKLMQHLGAQGTNAFTSFEQTVYVNDIPSNNLEKWLMVEGDRFANPVFRIFHTELEAVYEEKNISLDDDGDRVFETLFAHIFPTHPYGTQTTIGTVEHLKNPSLKKIKAYFTKNYVPNNMGIILAGDLDPDQTIALIDKYLGTWKRGPEVTFVPPVEPQINSSSEFTVTGPDAESVTIGFRLPGAGTQESIALQLISELLMNGKSGLFDKNLIKTQKVLSASASPEILKDYSMLYITAKPKMGQSLEELKNLLLTEVTKLNTGDFDATLLPAIIKNYEVSRIQQNESNGSRAYMMLDAFIVGMPWNVYNSQIEAMGKITVDDIKKIANKYLGNRSVIVYKKTGETPVMSKIIKPEITPVETNAGKNSTYYNQITAISAPPIKPDFIDFKSKIMQTNLAPDIPYYGIKNTDNSLFSTYFILDMGKFNNKKLPLAINYLKFIGTKQYSNEQLNDAFYKLACDFGISAGNDISYFSLSGPQENFDKAMDLFLDLLKNPQVDEAKFKDFVDNTLQSRENNLKNKSLILRAGLANYALYGAKNPFNYVLTNKEIKETKPAELIELIKSLLTYSHKVFYYGPKDPDFMQGELLKKLNLHGKGYPMPPKPVTFTRLTPTSPNVYFVDYDMVQAEILWTKTCSPYNPEFAPTVSLFNEYFGGGMGSVVFQTLRESKALAYSCYAYYNSPGKKEDPFQLTAYIGCQGDKMIDAITSMNELLTKFVRNDENLLTARTSLKKGIETERIRKEDIFWTWYGLQKLGLTADNRPAIYEGADKLTMDDLNNFFTREISKGPYQYSIIGKKQTLNMEGLKPFGTVIELNLNDLFGY